MKRDEVRSQVLSNVWRYWIAEARARLRSGRWSRSEICAKLRTSLCQYAKKKARTIATREDCRTEFLRGFAKQDETAAGGSISTWIEACEEERFLRGIVLESNGELRELSVECAATVLRLVAVVRRASRGFRKKGAIPWTWAQLVLEFSEVLEAV